MVITKLARNTPAKTAIPRSRPRHAPKAANRMLVGMVYLNDVKDGGETEFYYQKLKIKPKRGTLVIWPAYFTHLHRGNKPISNSKYIINMWANPTA